MKLSINISSVTGITLLLMLFFSACTPGKHHRFPGHYYGQQIVSTAERYIGVPYRAGGTTPRGFDCSGFVQYVYRQNGIELPRSAEDQFRMGRRISVHAARPGDLVFFRTSGRRISHVGIYNGNGRFIHAPSTGGHVEYASMDNIYWNRRVVGAATWMHMR